MRTEIMVDSEFGGRYIFPGQRLVLDGTVDLSAALVLVGIFAMGTRSTRTEPYPWDAPDLEVSYRERCDDGRVMFEISQHRTRGLRMWRSKFFDVDNGIPFPVRLLPKLESPFNTDEPKPDGVVQCPPT